ncbi:MAG: hypothetical protein QE271_02890 [Bacteriovoracaceae bacterium]|nr:hypothetical protein [Bacteriovoracaceae bacterium]
MTHEDKKSQFSELIKKVITTGMGAAFMTEDAIKSLLADGSISKDVLSNFLQNAKGMKDEVVGQVLLEIKNKLAPFKIDQEIDRILQNYDLEVKANIRFQKRKDPKNSAQNAKKNDEDENSSK